jgi:heat shock protein HslJ
MRSVVPAAGLVLLLTACSGPPKPPNRERFDTPPPKPITDREWVLVALATEPVPAGRDHQPATLRLEASPGRAVGFAGCNRFSASYTLAGDSLRFGPATATKMACADGDELERGFLGALPAVSIYQATDSTLTLEGPTGPVLRFHAR